MVDARSVIVKKTTDNCGVSLHEEFSVNGEDFPKNYSAGSIVQPALLESSMKNNKLTFFPLDWGMLRRSRRVLIFL